MKELQKEVNEGKAQVEGQMEQQVMMTVKLQSLMPKSHSTPPIPLNNRKEIRSG